MQDRKQLRKHVWRISPHQDLMRGFDRWVGKLRSIEQVPDIPLNPHSSVEQGGYHEADSSAQGYGFPRPTDEAGRWQDDGGESA
jgi:hypothetical protein